MSKDFVIEVQGAQTLSALEKLKDFSGIAENDATKRATKKIERELINVGKEKINLKVGRLKKGLSVNARGGTVRISGRAPTLFQFLTPGQQRKLQGGMYRDPKKPGLAIRYFKDRPRVTVEGTFLITGRGGNPLVVRRKNRTDPRSKLEALYGRWVRDLWEIKNVRDDVFEAAANEYTQRFQSTFDKLKRGVI
jgi:hypothetical protein